MLFFWNDTMVQWHYNEKYEFLNVFNEKPKILLEYKIERICL